MKWTIYAMLCVMLPCAIYQSLFIRKYRSRKILAIHILLVYIFLLYICMVLSATGIASIWDIGKFGRIVRPEEINLLPFQSEGLMTYILNIILFLPLGFLLPLIWRNLRNAAGVLLTGFCFSLSIELCQLFNRRITDIDDLLMNTLGTLIGYFLWYISRKLFKRINQRALSFSKKEPYIYLALAILGKFLLFNWRFLL